MKVTNGVILSIIVLMVSAPSYGDQARTSSCLTDPSVLEDLKRREDLVRDRDAELKKKEEELVAREKALSERIAEMEEYKKEISKLEGLRDEKREEQVTKLVETMERMSPKASAKLITEIDEILAVEAMKRMSTERLAKVMNLLEAEKASRLSERLTGIQGRIKPRNPASAAAATRKAASPERGGKS